MAPSNPPDPPGAPGAERRASAAAFEQAGRILLEAEALSGEERERFFERECAGDAELLDLLRSMAPDLDASRAFLSDAPGAALRARLERDLTALGHREGPDAGARLGPFRVIRRLAEGGMGSVYEAEQTAPRRRVALKVVAPGMASSDVLARFRREGDVLAHLSHPGIAKVLAVSEPDAPEPWFAMELVDGLPLTEHARARGLSVPERLGLLAATSDAVAHAHARGVVHRDLKPANILVDQAGHPRVLDFGVARATELESRASTLLTRTGDLVGTLAYMSPEQAWGRHEQVDARADVFALGVIGFELLTGRLPRRLENLSVGEALHVLREGDVERADSVDKSLRGDVATLIAKALDADPARRYANAAELAADIRRCLSHEPIVARPPSITYRVGKFLRRHRTLALITGAAFLALAAVTGVALRSASETARARDVAERQALRAHLAAASAAMDAGNVDSARRSLDAVPAGRRGWEWAVLSARAAGPDLSARVACERVLAMSAADDAAFLACESPGGRSVIELSLDELSVTGRGEPAPEAAALLAFLAPLPAAVSGGLPELSATTRSPDGSLIAWRGHGRVGVVDALTGARLFELSTADIEADARGSADAGTTDEGVMGATFSRSGRELLVASFGAVPRLRRLDARSGALLAERATTGRPVWDAGAWAVAGALVAWSPGDGSIHLFDEALAGQRGIVYLPGGEPPRSMALTPDGKRLVAWDATGSVHRWELDGALVPRILPAHDSYVYSVAFSPDGGRFVTAGWDGRVRTWDARTLRMLVEIPWSDEAPYLADAIFLAGGERLAVLSTSGIVSLVDATTGETLATRSLQTDFRHGRLGVDPRGELLVASPSWHGVGGSMLRVADLMPVAGYEDVGNSADWSPHEAVLAATTRSGEAVLIDRLSGARRPLGIPKQDSSTLVGGMRWSPDGRLVLATCYDGRVLVLDGASGTLIRELRAPEGGVVYDAVASPDGHRIVSAGSDGAIRTWDARSGELLATWSGHRLYVHGLAFSPDGQTLLSASGDRTIRRWSTR